MTCNLLFCYFVGNPRPLAGLPLYMFGQINVVFTTYLALEAVVEKGGDQHTPLSTIFDV